MAFHAHLIFKWHRLVISTVSLSHKPTGCQHYALRAAGIPARPALLSWALKMGASHAKGKLVKGDQKNTVSAAMWS